VLVEAVPRVEGHVLAVVELTGRQEVLLWNFDSPEPQIEYPGLSDISPNRPRNQPITLQPGGD